MIARLRRWLDLACGPAPLVPGMWLFGNAHRQTILAALEDAADYRLDQGDCYACIVGSRRGQKCDDHAADEAMASMYDDLAARLYERTRPRNRLSRQLALGLLEDSMGRVDQAAS